MSYRDEVLLYFDLEELMSRRPNATFGEEGNPVTETGTAYLIMKMLKQDQPEDKARFERAMEKLARTALPYKKPGSRDPLSHDDLIALVAGSVALNSYWHHMVYNWGVAHGWDFTTDAIQFENFAKPWYIAFYQLAVGVKPSAFDHLLLCGSIVFDAFFNMDSASDKRLTWLMLKTLAPKDGWLKVSEDIWRWRIKKTYGSVARIFVKYKNSESHPFSKYCPE